MENVLIRLEEVDEHIIERAGKRTNSNYIKNGIISIDTLIGIIDNLVDEIDDLKEEIQHIEQNIQDNYRPISQAEQYDISDRYFK